MYICIPIVDNYYLFLGDGYESDHHSFREWNKGAGMTHTAVGLSRATWLPSGYVKIAIENGNFIVI